MRVESFKEWDRPRVLRLTPREAAILGKLSDREFNVRPRGNGAYLVGPAGGYVGNARLSDDLLIEVQPKVPIVNLVQLISLAFVGRELPRLKLAGSFVESTPADWLAFLLLSEVEKIVSAGILSDYNAAIETLPYVRGRLLIPVDGRAGSDNLCEYSEFTEDILANRIIRGTLEHLSVQRLSRFMRQRILSVLRYFERITFALPTMGDVRSVVGDRRTAYYAPALRLCELYLSGRGVESSAGDVRASSIFLPMHTIFERAFVNALRLTLKSCDVLYQPRFLDRIQHIEGVPNYTIMLQPDIVVSGSRPSAVLKRQNSPVLVIDTKYRTPTVRSRHGEGFRNADIYQILAYCSTLGTSGILVYPRVKDEIDATYRVNETKFRLLSADLSIPDLGGLWAAVEKAVSTIPRFEPMVA